MLALFSGAGAGGGEETVGFTASSRRLKRKCAFELDLEDHFTCNVKGFSVMSLGAETHECDKKSGRKRKMVNYWSRDR